MTDLLPAAQRLMDDSYESDLTEEESERLLLMSEHAIAPPLSPAAQAVLDAVLQKSNLSPTVPVAAAALRVAADRVVPWQPEPTEDTVGPTIDYGYAWALFSKANDIRQELLNIAAELEGANAQ